MACEHRSQMMRARMWGVRMGDVELEHANFLESERVYGLSANIIFCPTNLPTLSLTDVRVTAVTGLTARPSCIRPSLQPRFFFNPEIAQIMPNGAYMELFSFTHPRIVPSTHKPIPRSPRPPTMGKQSRGCVAYAFIGALPSPSHPFPSNFYALNSASA